MFYYGEIYIADYATLFLFELSLVSIEIKFFFVNPVLYFVKSLFFFFLNVNARDVLLCGNLALRESRAAF